MSDLFRIAIVGSGPAGLSAASRAAKLGLSHILLEKAGRLSDTIYRYQKGKHVMATPEQLVLRSDLPFEAGKREAIIDIWGEQAEANGVNVRLNAEVKAITGRKGAFKLKLTTGETLRAETVILAIGTQGDPNLLHCPGGALPHVQYTLDDPGEYSDEHISVIGGGDAGIENALGLAADPEQRNVVTLVNREPEFATAKEANVAALFAARDEGRLIVRPNTTTTKRAPGAITFDTADGEVTVKCNRIIARLGSAPPRAFVEGCGVAFTSEDRLSYPKLSPRFETTRLGIFVIGALSGYPLIKHGMNQGYDVVEFINGNAALEPADEPILEAKFASLPGTRSIVEWLELLRSNVLIFNNLSMLQMREFMLDVEMRAYCEGEVIFERNDPGSTLFAVAQGSVLVRGSTDDLIGAGLIFGEEGLICGRRRSATILAAEDMICVEIPRAAALKLQSSAPAAKRAIERLSTERQLLQMFGSGVQREDLRELLDHCELQTVSASEPVIVEGEKGNDIYVIRHGSMVAEKKIGGKPVFLYYFPAGSFIGEVALTAGSKCAVTIRATVKSEVIKVEGETFRKLLAAKPKLRAKLRTDMAARMDINGFVEARKDNYSSVVDMYSNVASFMVENDIGEAANVLLIDENLCIGCDNCEKACADSHDGLSRLDREAGRTYAHLHVPTSCRHCEHPLCMTDCPPDAIHRSPDGEVFIDDSCIGCGNCQRFCPYDVIQMDVALPRMPGLLERLFLGREPGFEKTIQAVKCDMCLGIEGGPACVRACPTGAAISIAPGALPSVARLEWVGS